MTDDRFRPRPSVFIPKDWNAQFSIVCRLLRGWARFQGSKWPQSPLPCGALAQEKEGVGRVGGITGGQVDATI
jgi:hypothetical protein